MTRCTPSVSRPFAASRASCSSGPRSARPWSTCPTCSTPTQTSSTALPRCLAWLSPLAPPPPPPPLNLTTTVLSSLHRMKGRTSRMWLAMGRPVMGFQGMAWPMGTGSCMGMGCKKMRWCLSHRLYLGKASAQAKRSAHLARLVSSTLHCPTLAAVVAFLQFDHSRVHGSSCHHSRQQQC